jgi:hypothetical protein
MTSFVYVASKALAEGGRRLVKSSGDLDRDIRQALDNFIRVHEQSLLQIFATENYHAQHGKMTHTYTALLNDAFHASNQHAKKFHNPLTSTLKGGASGLGGLALSGTPFGWAAAAVNVGLEAVPGMFEAGSSVDYTLKDLGAKVSGHARSALTPSTLLDVELIWRGKTHDAEATMAELKAAGFVQGNQVQHHSCEKISTLPVTLDDARRAAAMQACQAVHAHYIAATSQLDDFKHALYSLLRRQLGGVYNTNFVNPIAQTIAQAAWTPFEKLEADHQKRQTAAIIDQRRQQQRKAATKPQNNKRTPDQIAKQALNQQPPRKPKSAFGAGASDGGGFGVKSSGIQVTTQVTAQELENFKTKVEAERKWHEYAGTTAGNHPAVRQSFEKYLQEQAQKYKQTGVLPAITEPAFLAYRVSEEILAPAQAYLAKWPKTIRVLNNVLDTISRGISSITKVGVSLTDAVLSAPPMHIDGDDLAFWNSANQRRRELIRDTVSGLQADVTKWYTDLVPSTQRLVDATLKASEIVGAGQALKAAKQAIIFTALRSKPFIAPNHAIHSTLHSITTATKQPISLAAATSKLAAAIKAECAQVARNLDDSATHLLDTCNHHTFQPGFAHATTSTSTTHLRYSMPPSPAKPTALAFSEVKTPGPKTQVSTSIVYNAANAASTKLAASIPTKFKSTWEKIFGKDFEHLWRHEKGIHDGHALDRHAGKTILELKARNIRAVSTYPDIASADQVIAEVIARRIEDIDGWYHKAPIGRTQDFSVEFERAIGLGLKQGENVLTPRTKALVVVQKMEDETIKIVTSYPI